MKKTKLLLNIEEVKSTLMSLLKYYNVPKEIAEIISDTLLDNDAHGYTSHGIMRLRDYIEDIANSKIDPKAFPQYEKISSNSFVVNGENCFGILSAQTVAKLLKESLQTENIATVSLQNAHHIGRLASVALPVLEKGAVILGFSNYNGLGNKTIGWQGKQALFSTNPLLMAAPTSSRPIVLDMSTSSVSEGKIRTAWMNDEKVPDGWLVNGQWENIDDPNYFYKTPMEAFLTPLGGKEQGYKGFGLSLMVEILSSILSGGSHIGKPAESGGNSALFIAIQPEIFGINQKVFLQEMDHLMEKIKSNYTNVHFPGWRQKKNSISVNTGFWEWMQKESSYKTIEKTDF